jgi:hypothetical protein
MTENQCKGCKLYSSLCLIVTLGDPKLCPCLSCLVKPTCVSRSQTCEKYDLLILDVKRKHNLETVYHYEIK